MRESRPASVEYEPAPRLWEQVAAGLICAMLTGALIGPLFAPTQEETPMLRLVWPPVYLIIFTLVGFRARAMIRVWPAWLALFLLVALAFASKYWSIDPAVTQRRVIAMGITGMFAIYLGAVFRGPHFPRLLMQTGIIMALASIVMVFAYPTIGVHQDVNAGLWRGLWYEKNQMGMVMVMVATAATAVLTANDKNRFLAAATLVLASVLVLATESKTSLLSLMLGVGFVCAFWTLKRAGPALGIVLVWLGVVAAAFGIWIWSTHSVEILEALGKDPSLTGRTDIWEALMRRVADRPWTGFGYKAFWGRESVPAEYIRLETGWDVPSAHNGWIDLLIELGWPGAVLVGLLCASALVCGLLRAGTDGAQEGWFSMAYLAVFGLLSTSESILMTHQSLPWVLFLAILTRTVCGDPQAAPAPLVGIVPEPYQSPSRIAPKSVYGRQQRPFPVR